MNSKFRVWDTGGEMHHPPHQFYISSEGVVCWHSLSSIKHDSVGVYTPLFYTGLDDAEGTPIYEGDLFRSDDALFEVQWGDEKAYFELCAVDGTTNLAGGVLRGGLHHHTSQGNIVGNVFQTPELLD